MQKINRREFLNAWNEWTEGCYLLPEEQTGTARLEAIKRTFGVTMTDKRQGRPRGCPLQGFGVEP